MSEHADGTIEVALTGEEAQWCLLQMQPGMGPITLPITAGYHGLRTCHIPIEIGHLILARRQKERAAEKLASAAPDLLAACKAAISHIEAVAGFVPTTYDKILLGAHTQLKSAISKATT